MNMKPKRSITVADVVKLEENHNEMYVRKL